MLELLAPAGNFEKAQAAIRFGADAIYFAGPSFGMRSSSTALSAEEVAKTVALAHENGVRAYVAVNTMPREDEYPALREYLSFLARVAPDALIVADIGVLFMAKEIAPNLPIHLSTQANAVSAAACRAWYALGVSRIVLARELSFDEIRAIRASIPKELELEAFVHGSMCMSYSGRCLLSSYLTGRDANRGQCTQPCRWNYKMGHFEGVLYEEKRPDLPIPIEEENGESFFMSSTDLCMVDHIAELAEAGITSLKIEGRMKSAYYTATVTNTYRMAIDAWKTGAPPMTDAWRRELDSVSHRPYATGFYFGLSGGDARITRENSSHREKAYLAEVISYNAESGEALCIQWNKLTEGMRAEVLTPKKVGHPFTVSSLQDEHRTPISSAPHPQMLFYMRIPFEVAPGDLVRESLPDSN